MTTSQTQASDARLVAGLIEGDEAGLAELMGRYGGALRGVLARLTPDWEDLSQEAWIRVVRHASRYDPAYAFSTWLFRIAWNLAMTNQGRAARWATEDLAPETAGSDPHPEAEALARERRAAVHLGIQDLPEHLAETVLLRHFEELSEREIAQRLGIPAGTVKSRLHHAHRRLADLLGGLR